MMAVLSPSDRAAVRRGATEIIGGLSGTDRSIPIDRTQLLAVVNAADDWVDANGAAFNAAIPQPQRGLLTAKQKALILSAVVRRRYEIS